MLLQARLNVFFLICLFVASSASTLEETQTNKPSGFCNTSLTEAIKLLQVKNIQSLEEKILDQIDELGEKDVKIEALKSEVELEKNAREDEAARHVSELASQREALTKERRTLEDELRERLERSEEELEGSQSLVSYMMEVLQHSEEMMEERQDMITKQGHKLKEVEERNRVCRHKTADSVRLVAEQWEVIKVQRESIEELKEVIGNETNLNSTIIDNKSKDPMESKCNLPEYLLAVTAALNTQQVEISNLKLFKEGEQKIDTHLENISRDIQNQSRIVDAMDQNWDLLLKCQTIVEKQSNSISLMRTLASYAVNNTTTFRYEEDPPRRLVSAKSCTCIPDVPDETEVSLTLARRGEVLETMWSSWEFVDCFQWRRSDNTTIDCGAGGRKVRRRLKDLAAEEWREEVQEEACQECPRVAEIKLSGTFSVPSDGHGSYRDNMNESQDIEVPVGAKIQFTFIRFSTEQEYDTVTIVDGNGLRILHASGSTIPAPVSSFTNKATVTFLSDGGRVFTGFFLNWVEI